MLNAMAGCTAILESVALKRLGAEWIYTLLSITFNLFQHSCVLKSIKNILVFYLQNANSEWSGECLPESKQKISPSMRSIFQPNCHSRNHCASNLFIILTLLTWYLHHVKILKQLYVYMFEQQGMVKNSGSCISRSKSSFEHKTWRLHLAWSKVKSKKQYITKTLEEP